MAVGADVPTQLDDQQTPGERVLLQTSGTTGEPTAVPLTDAMLQAHRDACADILGHQSGIHWLLALPLTHMGGVAVLDRCLRDDVALTTLDDYTAPAIADVLPQATHVSLVPVQLRRLLERMPTPPRSLQCVLLGGDAAPPQLLEEALAAGWPIYASYGMTETCGQVATATPDEQQERLGTVGRPLPGVKVAIDDGEIVVSGPTVARGGPHHTGDLGRLDDDGFLYVTGRLSHRIVTGGRNVDARHVERVLLSAPGVDDCAVVGIADDEWGQRVAALVDGSLDGLEWWCSQHLADHERPRVWRQGLVPRTEMGKARLGQILAYFDSQK